MLFLKDCIEYGSLPKAKRDRFEAHQANTTSP